jgi:predicted helicase
LKVIYENFYKVYNAKAADRLGVVYTPNEIVRFMIEGADWLCEKHFERNLIDKNVEILDPATGTGTFICELLEHFRGQLAKLKHKYREELHANEVAILPYYVANLNIEATYAAITGEYEEFKNLCFVDTLDNVGLHTSAVGVTHDLFGSVSEENVARIKRQNTRRISVVIGNPPYNANQANENDNNKNREYPAIDKRIKQTYIHESNAQKTKLYDMYARFFRWASDRLAADGVLAFVTNRSFIDSRTFDGFRKTVAQEFSEAYIVDLGGDVRANPKLSGTKHNVFGIQTGVAISFFVKRHGAAGKKGARVFYARRPEMETAEEKLAWLGSARASVLEFDEVRPDAKGNWLNLTSNDFDELLPVATKDGKRKALPAGTKSVFWLYASGIKTNRDEWVYDFNASTLAAKIKLFADRLDAHSPGSFDPSIKWSRDLKLKVARAGGATPREGHAVQSLFRPFVRQAYWANKTLSDILTEFHYRYYARSLQAQNPTIAFLCVHSSNPLAALATNGPFDYCLLKRGNGGTESIARWVLQEDGSRIDNITDWSLAQFKKHYQPGNGKKSKPITKEAIFHYVYAVLHDPLYREKYAQNLKREFPRIPLYGDSESTFWQWAAWGERLMALHIGYESVEPFAQLKRSDMPDTKVRAAGQSPKPALKSDKTAGTITLDSETTLAGVPPEAWRYQLGNRCAIDWVLDQYKEKKPKDPTIREKFDTYRFADHKEKVIDLLARVTTVSVETIKIVDAMRGATR